VESLLLDDLQAQTDMDPSKLDTIRKFEQDEETTRRPLYQRSYTRSMDRNFSVRSMTRLDGFRRMGTRIMNKSSRIYPEDEVKSPEIKQEGLVGFISRQVFLLRSFTIVRLQTERIAHCLSFTKTRI